MENQALGGRDQRKGAGSKKSGGGGGAKTKKKPMKVVYISNPMKFKASPSEFRALVQELTGQDAELPDPTKFVDPDDVGAGGNQTVPDTSKSSSDRGADAIYDDHDADAAAADVEQQQLEVPTGEEVMDPSPERRRSQEVRHQMLQPEITSSAERVAAVDALVPLGSYDDVFLPQTLDNLTAFMPLSSLLFGSS